MNEALCTALAACRDAFGAPLPGGYGEDEWMAAMANPLSVPVFVQKMLAQPGLVRPVANECACRTCKPVSLNDMRFVVCPKCGNKRCPKANDHRNQCTRSNEPGQPGSAYPLTVDGVC